MRDSFFNFQVNRPEQNSETHHRLFVEFVHFAASRLLNFQGQLF